MDDAGEQLEKARRLVRAEDVRHIPLVRGRFEALDSIVSRGPIHGGPYVGSEPYDGKPYDPQDCRVIKGGWDHEHCLVCSARVAPGDEWWASPQQRYVGVCPACHAEFFASGLAWRNRRLAGSGETSADARPETRPAMTEAVWMTSAAPGPMLGYLKVLPRSRELDRKLRLFACACARRAWDLLVDERSRRAVEQAERYADGLASPEELDEAGGAADAASSRLYVSGGLAAADDARIRSGHDGRPAGAVFGESPAERAWNASMAAAKTTLRKVGRPGAGTWYEWAYVAALGASSSAWDATAAAAELRAEEAEDRAADPDGDAPLLARDVVAGAAELREREAGSWAVRLARPPRVRPWQAELLRCLLGNPLRPVAFDPSWRDSASLSLARTIYEHRAFDRLPDLAAALAKTGCHAPDILDHCRQPGGHARGCWVIDALLGKT